jgi:hypothetical protein
MPVHIPTLESSENPTSDENRAGDGTDEDDRKNWVHPITQVGGYEYLAGQEYDHEPGNLKGTMK